MLSYLVVLLEESQRAGSGRSGISLPVFSQVTHLRGVVAHFSFFRRH